MLAWFFWRGEGAVRARADPEFSFISELIYGGRRISELPRGPRKWSARSQFLSPTPRIVFLARRARARWRIHTESYDLDSNFCEADRSSTLNLRRCFIFATIITFFYYTKFYRTRRLDTQVLFQVVFVGKTANASSAVSEKYL